MEDYGNHVDIAVGDEAMLEQFPGQIVNLYTRSELVELDSVSAEPGISRNTSGAFVMDTRGAQRHGTNSSRIVTTTSAWGDLLLNSGLTHVRFNKGYVHD